MSNFPKTKEGRYCGLNISKLSMVHFELLYCTGVVTQSLHSPAPQETPAGKSLCPGTAKAGSPTRDWEGRSKGEKWPEIHDKNFRAWQASDRRWDFCSKPDLATSLRRKPAAAGEPWGLCKQTEQPVETYGVGAEQERRRPSQGNQWPRFHLNHCWHAPEERTLGDSRISLPPDKHLSGQAGEKV